jgi:hypothetical protein
MFSLMTRPGLRETHTPLDICCGLLRAGKLFLMYLLADRYFESLKNGWSRKASNVGSEARS